jgi:hypothetical protein
VRAGAGGHWLRWRDDLGLAQLDQPGPYPTRSSTPPSLSQLRSPARTASSSLVSATPLGPAQVVQPISIDGKCIGKLCQQRKDKVPRACSTCDHGLCKKDCLALQKENPRVTCSEKRHRSEEVTNFSPGAGTTGESSGSSLDSSNQDVFYDPTKPLRQEHYQAQQEAFNKYQIRVEAVEERKRQEELLHKQILILFWKQVSRQSGCLGFRKIDATYTEWIASQAFSRTLPSVSSFCSITLLPCRLRCYGYHRECRRRAL